MPRRFKLVLLVGGPFLVAILPLLALLPLSLPQASAGGNSTVSTVVVPLGDDDGADPVAYRPGKDCDRASAGSPVEG
jgi:hypothetical protein